MKNKFISPSMFALILICLALPFITISCEGQELQSLSGYNLAFGSDIQGQQTDGSFVAVMMLLLAIAGACLYFWRHQLNSLIGGILGVLGTIFTFILKSGINQKIQNEVTGITVEYKAGFYLTLLVFISAAAYNLYNYFTEKKETLVLPAGSRFCSDCGQKITGEDEFCSSCGTKQE